MLSIGMDELPIVDSTPNKPAIRPGPLNVAVGTLDVDSLENAKLIVVSLAVTLGSPGGLDS